MRGSGILGRLAVLGALLLSLEAGVAAQTLLDDRWACQADQTILGVSTNMHLGAALATGGDWDGDGNTDVLAMGALGVLPILNGSPITTSVKILRDSGSSLTEVLEVTGIEVG